MQQQRHIFTMNFTLDVRSPSVLPSVGFKVNENTLILSKKNSWKNEGQIWFQVSELSTLSTAIVQKEKQTEGPCLAAENNYQKW